jgi:hypothetical protein
MPNPAAQLPNVKVNNTSIYRAFFLIKLVKFPIIISLFFVTILSILFGSFWLHQRINHTKQLNTLVATIAKPQEAKVVTLNAGVTKNVADIVSSITASDARPILVNRFLEYYDSPMTGKGQAFVELADKYGLDYRLLPAIALHESSAGKRIPPGSYNAWGWAVFTGQQTGAEFDTWEHGIETVAKGLRKGYVDDGLITPEKIMPRYAPPSSSWADGVRTAMNQISAN